jgi:hemoglobin
MSETLYDRLGGSERIEQVVDHLYASIMEDKRLNHFFSETDIDKQKQHQAKFLTVAFGGAPAYPGRTLAAAHTHLKADHHHYDWVMEHIEEALYASDIRGKDATEALDRIEQYRTHVVH